LKTHPVVRWFFVGAIFLGIGLSLLQLFVGLLGWPFWAASLVQAELCTLLRFLANERWVFCQGQPTWARLGKYHVANAGGFAVCDGERAAAALKRGPTSAAPPCGPERPTRP